MILPCSESWGAQTFVWSDPIVEIHKDVLYVPLSHRSDISTDGEWGLFSSDGSLIEAAAYRRGSQARMVGHPARAPLSISDLPFEDGEDWLYTGPMLLHYGHFVTASIARLWKASSLISEETRLLCHGLGQPGLWVTKPHMKAVFDSMSIAMHRFMQFNKPVRLRRVVVPRPSIEEQNFVHRRFGAFCYEIGRSVLADRPVAPNDRPAYLSKSRLAEGVGRFSDEAEIEDCLTREGVEIFHPQDMNFLEQVALFEERKVVLGTLGSAFHTAAFVRPHGYSVCLAPGRSVNSNFRLIDMACGRRAAYYYPSGGVVQTTGENGFLSSFRLKKPRAVAEMLLRVVDAGPAIY